LFEEVQESNLLFDLHNEASRKALLSGICANGTAQLDAEMLEGIAHHVARALRLHGKLREGQVLRRLQPHPIRVRLTGPRSSV
jgi:hypothetical protein